MDSVIPRLDPSPTDLVVTEPRPEVDPEWTWTTTHGRTPSHPSRT